MFAALESVSMTHYVHKFWLPVLVRYILEHPKSELRHDRQYVIKDVCLNGLKLVPYRLRAEGNDFDRQSVVRGL